MNRKEWIRYYQRIINRSRLPLTMEDLYLYADIKDLPETDREEMKDKIDRYIRYLKKHRKIYYVKTDPVLYYGRHSLMIFDLDILEELKGRGQTEKKGGEHLIEIYEGANFSLSIMEES